MLRGQGLESSVSSLSKWWLREERPAPHAPQQGTTPSLAAHPPTAQKDATTLFAAPSASLPSTFAQRHTRANGAASTRRAAPSAPHALPPGTPQPHSLPRGPEALPPSRPEVAGAGLGGGRAAVALCSLRRRLWPRANLKSSNACERIADPESGCALSALQFVCLSHRYILVRMKSAAETGYCFNVRRLRLQEKLVLLRYDPIAKQRVLFTEKRKIRSL
uniref:Large ribosomal subunit protein bL33m n=1 Tax=Gallus gallus TaxID=9031 RepID=A0A8V0ZBF1_CHICK